MDEKKKKQGAKKDAAETAEKMEAQAVDITIDEEGVRENAPKDEAADASAEIDMDALRAEVEKIIKERDDYLTMLQRVSADFDNYKKRNAQLRLDARKDTQFEVLSAILPVYDNLERALEASQKGESDALTKGVDMVVRQFKKALEDIGMQEIASEPGTAFDPTLHDAAVTVPSDDQHPDNTIFDTLQKGYSLGDRVLRYATVRVAQDG